MSLDGTVHCMERMLAALMLYPLPQSGDICKIFNRELRKVYWLRRQRRV